MIRHLSLFYGVRDLDRACALFEAALDVEFTRRRHQEQMHYFVAELAGVTVLELWPTGGGAVSRVQLEFAVADLDVAADRLIKAGFEVRRLSGAALMTDPNGNTVALISPATRR